MIDDQTRHNMHQSQLINFRFLASGEYSTQQEHKVCFITEQSQCYNVPSSAECAVNSWSQRKSWSRVLYTLCTHYVHWAGVRVGGLCKKYTYSVYTVMSVHCASHQAGSGGGFILRCEELFVEKKNPLSSSRKYCIFYTRCF